MIGFDDRESFDDDDLRPARGIIAGIGITLVCALIAALILGLSWSSARAQMSQPSNCSGTATNTAAVIAFPTSGETGPTFPSQYLTITNPDASATLWVCAAKNCTAAANGAGSIALSPTGSAGQNGISWWKGAFPPPARVGIISTAASQAFTCNYQ